MIHGEERFLVDRSIRTWRERARPPELDIEVFETPGRLDELRIAVAETHYSTPNGPSWSAIRRSSPARRNVAARSARSGWRRSSPSARRPPFSAWSPTPRCPDETPCCGSQGDARRDLVPPAVKGRELRAWVEKEIAARQLRLGPGSVEHLIRVAGPDLGSIASELDKLVVRRRRSPFSISDVRAAVAGDEATGLYETLGDLLGPMPAKGAESIDHLLAEGRAGQYLLAILAGQIRDLVFAQAYFKPMGLRAGLAAADRQAGLGRGAPGAPGPVGAARRRGRLARRAARSRSKAQDWRDLGYRRAAADSPPGRGRRDRRRRQAARLEAEAAAPGARRGVGRDGLAGAVVLAGAVAAAWVPPSPGGPSRVPLPPEPCPQAWRRFSRRGPRLLFRAPAFRTPSRGGARPQQPSAPSATFERRAAIDASRDLRRRTLLGCSTPFSAARSRARMAACSSVSPPAPPSSSSA